MTEIEDEYQKVNRQLLSRNMPEISRGQFLIIFGDEEEFRRRIEEVNSNIQHMIDGLKGINND